MRRLDHWGLRTLAVLLGALAPGSAWALPAFPGAEGFGAVASGGRGGPVIKVTTLDSSGPGSLQEALATPGARIIVFDVSGVIEGDQEITYGDVTIAGQTAPGAGITIAGRLSATYDSSVQNIIVRHVRVRPTYDGSPGEQFDALQLSLNERVILDHVTVSGGVDETADLYEAKQITIQWSTIEESATSGHPEGEHNYGLINGPDGLHIAVHHTLFAHHQNRCPAVANGPAEIRNNVVYNVRHGFVHHNPASGPFNIVGNVYIQGPDDSLIPFYFDDENDGTAAGLTYYLHDNFIDDPDDFVGAVENPWQDPPLHPSFEDLYLDESFRSETELEFSGAQQDYIPVTTHSSTQARDLVLAYAGAFPRDAATLRTIADVEARTGSWGVKAQNDLLEGLTPGDPPADADGDGMADAWEVEHGLDPSDPNDHDDVMASGYTAIEDYINALADSLIGATGGVPPGGGNPGGGTGGQGSNGPGSGGLGSAAGGSAEGDEGCACRTSVPTSSSGLAWPLAASLLLGSAWRRRRRP